MRFGCVIVAMGLYVGCSSGNNNCGAPGTCQTNAQCSQPTSTCVLTHATDCAGSCAAIGGTSSSCSGSNGTETCVESVTLADAGVGCPAQPTSLTGTVAAGGACTTAKDCKPSCCACPGGGPLLGAQCSASICASSQQSCTAAMSHCP